MRDLIRLTTALVFLRNLWRKPEKCGVVNHFIARKKFPAIASLIYSLPTDLQKMNSVTVFHGGRVKTMSESDYRELEEQKTSNIRVIFRSIKNEARRQKSEAEKGRGPLSMKK